MRRPAPPSVGLQFNQQGRLLESVSSRASVTGWDDSALTTALTTGGEVGRTSDSPCFFFHERALENCEFLESVLDRGWLERSTRHLNIGIGTTDHPLALKWATTGAGAFIELNALAEDLRLVSGISGAGSVIEDLRDSSRFAATNHVVHSAALFERYRRGTVLRFHPQTAERQPDFTIESNGVEVPIEAKRFGESRPSEEFTAYAESIWREMKARIFIEPISYPALHVVVKDFSQLPRIDEVISTLSHVFALKSASADVRMPTYNVLVRPAPPPIVARHEGRSVCIYCRRSDKEDLRVESRAKDASKQLATYDPAVTEGVACFGLTLLQNPHYIKAMLDKRFAKNQFKGLAKVILMRYGTYLGKPQSSFADLIGTVVNTTKPDNDAFDFKLRGIAMVGNLFSAVAPEQEIPIYSFEQIEAKLTTEELIAGGGVNAPGRRHLPPDWFR